MRNILRANVEKLTKLWDSGSLKECYCLVFSPVYGFRIIWNDEDGIAHGLRNDSNILQNYFSVLAMYDTEEQAKNHLKDFIKWSETFN